ncbi:MAG: hypothetical protein HYW57_01115 [Ignavibacteriales bacterium]|nr:hypothetical protein [Ignavibacteriales bacterium]
MLWDTDIDLMGYHSSLKPKQYGIDLSKNLQVNLEVHAELGVARNADRHVITNGLLESEKGDIVDYLIGIRYLNEWNTTVIAEYYHNGFGFSRDEFQSYHGFLLNSLTVGTQSAIQQTLGVTQTYFRSSTLMKDYLYVRVSQPEPFDWLYFTPSIFTIYNLNDNSFLLSASLGYRPATNLEFILWPSVLVGEEKTEFGSRQARERVELWLRVYF